MHGCPVSPAAAAGSDHAPGSIRWILTRLSTEGRALPASDLPFLTIRVRRILYRCDIECVGDLEGWSEEELLALPNFGTGSLANLRTALAAIAGEAASDAAVAREYECRSGPTPLQEWTVSELAAALPSAIQAFEIERIPGIAARALTVLPSRGVQRIRDLIGVSTDTILSWPNLGGRAVESLSLGLDALLDQTRADPALAVGSREDVIRRLVAQTPFLQQLDASVEGMTEAQQTVCRLRLLTEDQPLTLEGVATRIGRTRERVRQLEVGARKVLDPHGDLKSAANGRLADLRRGRDTPLGLPELERLDPWFAGVAGRASYFAVCLDALRSDLAVVQVEEGSALVYPREAGPPRRIADAFKRTLDGRVQVGQLDEALAGFLEERSVSDLFPVIRELLADHVSCARGVVFDPRVIDRIEAIFVQSDGPLSLCEVEGRIRSAGIPLVPSAVRGCIDRLDVVRTGRSEYVFASQLKVWDAYKERLFEGSLPLMQADMRRQWGTAELLSVLHDAGHDWAAAMPIHAAEYLLDSEASPFRRLGRGMWCLRSAPGKERMRLIDVCADILEEAGAPLDQQELLRRVRRIRSFKSAFSFLWPIVQLARRRVGLGPRDLGIAQDAFDAICGDVGHLLEEHGRVSAADLRGLVQTHAPSAGEIRPDLLARAFRVRAGILLDGDDDGDGLRRSDVPRKGERVAPRRPSPRARTGASKPAPARRAPTPAAREGRSVTRATRNRPARRHTTDEIAARVRAKFGKDLPPATLRRNLLLAGWRYDAAHDTWARDDVP